jgi:hypothetical protein
MIEVVDLSLTIPLNVGESFVAGDPPFIRGKKSVISWFPSMSDNGCWKEIQMPFAFSQRNEPKRPLNVLSETHRNTKSPILGLNNRRAW